MKIFIIAVLLLNALVAAGYVLVCGLRTPKPRTLLYIKGAIMLCCPVVGAAFLCCAHIAGKVFYKPDPNRLESVFGKFRSRAVIVPDTESAMNVVPLEEALIVSDKADLRRLLLNVLKEDAESAISAVMSALESDDSEAAHYSASAVADVLAGFHERAQSMKDAVSANPENTLLYCELLDYFLWFLDKGLLANRELFLFTEQASDACEKLIGIDPTAVSPAYPPALVSLYIKTGDFDKAAYWAKRANELFPETLESFNARLRVLYAMDDMPGFRACLDELKRSDVVIDKSTLDLIRLLA